MAFREMGRQAGVSQTKAKEWRDWYDAGQDPEALPDPQPSSLAGMRTYLRLADELDFRRAGLRVAAERLEVVAGDLRREAEALSATEAVSADADEKARKGRKEVSAAKRRRSARNKKGA